MTETMQDKRASGASPAGGQKLDASRQTEAAHELRSIAFGRMRPSASQTMTAQLNKRHRASAFGDAWLIGSAVLVGLAITGFMLFAISYFEAKWFFGGVQTREE